ncbi:hypothetical protein [Yinghuangia sp. YIM S09857]|uniref:hypothetical protein n=1 Tax=Yinghuangia sp. YIM S09857 TaxID=3436929 RepID=UPI003F535671
MVTSNHEAAHRIIQEHPEVLAKVCELLDVPLPTQPTFEIVSPDVTEIRPLERRIDTVLRIDPPEGQGFLLAVESQRRCDSTKPVNWAYYVGYLAAKYENPVVLLVVTQNRRTAQWARGPFHFGPEGCSTLSLCPVIAGPGNIPKITDPAEAAANVGFAAFAATIHAHEPDAWDILDALASALTTGPRESMADYGELVEAGLMNTKAGEIWRHLMPIARTPDGTTIVGAARNEGRNEGRQEGVASSVLDVLDARGVELSQREREHVMACSDSDTLKRWLVRAVTADRAADVFADE